MIVAPSFGDIFRENSTQIGLLTVALPEEQLAGPIAMLLEDLIRVEAIELDQQDLIHARCN